MSKDAILARKQLKKFKIYALTLSIIFLLFTSTGLITLAADEFVEKPDMMDQTEGNQVSWERQENTTTDTWDSSSQAWEFGPYPSFSIFLQNGTEVTDANYVPLGEPFLIVISVQKSIFVGNSTLGQAGLQWNTQIYSQNGTLTGNAFCRVTYINSMQTKYWNESNTWHVESNINNQTEQWTNGVDKPYTQMLQTSFYSLDYSQSRVLESDQSWQIQIVGTFNSSTPMGPYWTNLEVTDELNSWINFGYSSWTTNNSPNRQVAVGQAGFVYGGYQESWTMEKLDMENNTVLSVSKGAEWKMRFTVTSSDLSNITVGIDLPWSFKNYVNVTGWYETVVSEQGGWLYNDSSSSYYWNDTVIVTRTEQVYGPHLEQQYTNSQNSLMINVTQQYWDYVTNEMIVVEQQQYVTEKLFLIYNQATYNFDIKQGYSYFSFDPVQQVNRDFLMLYPLNESQASSQFFDLSLAECNWCQVESNKYIIEFVGSFSNSTYSDNNEYYLQISVWGANNQIYANWEDTSSSDFQIAVDRPVAVTTILNSLGKPLLNTMFQTDVDRSFIVQSKIYGSSDLYQDLDAVGLSLRSSFGQWAANESWNSEIEIRLIKDLSTGELYAVTYNRTSVNRYVYGPYLGWAYVNVTEWHTEFNAETGTWDWVDSPHLIWNQTTMTDWHWENYRLNQTQYAIDPDSANIWIDTTQTWLNDYASEFQMPTSYAVLNDANISLVNGLVIVNLNASFTSNAPQGNYYWNMIFQNMTFGIDYTQNYGEHVITEWTTESIYYVNGSVTSGQAWYVTDPTTPLYTIYNGSKYQLSQLPYITIDGVNLPILGKSNYDSYNKETTTVYLFYDVYNPSLGIQPRYYQLLNGTKIYVEEAYQAIIRNIELNCSDAYRMIDNAKVFLPNGTIFETYMNFGEQDYSQRIWDSELGDIVPYHYKLLNGTIVYRNAPFETSSYNYTTNHWDISNPVYNVTLTKLLVDSVGNGVTLNGTVVLLRDPGYWQMLPDGSGYYLVMKNGTRITISNPWDVPDNERIVTIDGVNYLIGWTNPYYQGTLNGETLLIQGGGMYGYVQPFYYTDLSVEDGVKYELPYEGALATSWWDLEGVQSEGKKLPTTKSLTINGSEYVLSFDEDTKSYYILVDEMRQSVTDPVTDTGLYYSCINGVDNWNVTQGGWILKYGTWATRASQLECDGSLITTTGYDENSQLWSNYNKYGLDSENATLYLTLPNGSKIDVTSQMYLVVWKVEIDNQTYYTSNMNFQMESVTNENVTEYLNYISTLDDQKIYFSMGTAANRLDEIHIPIQGLNYSRLLAYTWAPQQIFDTIYIYNITIPELTGDPTHTGVYYLNGTEVAPETNFKVIGTPYGPGTRYYYGWNESFIEIYGANIPMANVSWNTDQLMYYFMLLDGSRIYSNHSFGWNGGAWNNETQQWQYLNNDPISGNVTASVVEGGYCIFLNNTVKIDVTTQYVQGGMPAQYLIMTNGTRFDVQWLVSEGAYGTTIGNQTYLFYSVNTFYNFTDSGITYSIVDYNQPDYRQILTASIYQLPTISSDSSTWAVMNTTSDSILHDETGYYLINASDLSRIDLQLVSDWWNFSETMRENVFSNTQFSNFYPRYSTTINETDYFVLDPSPILDVYFQDYSVEQAYYRYPQNLDVSVGGQTFNVTLISSSYWNQNLTIRRIATITIDEASQEIEDQYLWKEAYSANINGENVQVQLGDMNIYETHKSWGNTYTWMLTDLSISTSRQVYDIIVGTPSYGMWGIKSFATVEETGAIDLDGDLTTVDDQYFVRSLHEETNSRTETVERLWVEINWNPDATRIGDEVHVGSWMGKLHESWTTEWTQSYIWYYASNMSGVSSQEMQRIVSVVINNSSGVVNPGYWDISYMVKNQTWTDVVSNADIQNWDWIDDNTNEWDWIWFGLQQDFMVNAQSDNSSANGAVGLRYEFAGLTLYNDTEQTHYFMPKSVANITFVTPGEALGDFNSSGSILVPLDTPIEFGVIYNGINGTLFPYSDYRSMWGWWDKPIYGADFAIPNFENKPTPSVVDQLEFLVHFAGNQTSESSQENEISMKIDQRIGDWSLNPDIIDSRQQNSSGIMVPLQGNEVLANRSLAVNYYVTAFSAMNWDVMDDSGSSVDNNDIINSQRFDLTSQLSDVAFASVKLGSTYDWGKPTSETDVIRTFNVTSQTSPIRTFQSSFESDSGKSSTGFEFSSSMYFLTQIFPHWDGYSIYNDPKVSLLASKGTEISENPFADNPIFLIAIGAGIAAAVISVVAVRVYKKKEG